jgi:hypothetical protein
MHATSTTPAGWRRSKRRPALPPDGRTSRASCSSSRSDSDLAYLDRVWLNRLVQSTTQAFDVERWKALAKPRAIAKRARIVLGFDGAQSEDSTAIVAVDILTGYVWLVKLWERPTTWPANQEWLVPAEEVDETIRQLFTDFDVWRLYADPPYWADWISKWIGEFGEQRVIKWFTNRRRQMAAALEKFDTAVKTAGLSHDGSPDLTRHVGNARRKNIGTDDQGKPIWLIQKERKDSPFKIDAAMAAVLGVEARSDAVAAGMAKPPTTRRRARFISPDGIIRNYGAQDATNASTPA